MATVARINKFVSKMMDKYSMPLYHYFDDCEDDENYVIFKNNKTDEKTIKKVCRLLGITEKEIREVNIEAANKWYNKFAFFKYFLQYRTANYYAQFNGSIPEIRLLQAIFGDEVELSEKYSEEVVKTRIIETLSEVEKIIPGTLHKNAEIFDLHYEAEDFISFPHLDELIRSFIELVERHKELFFKIWHNDLTDDEIKEYDFLTSFLRAFDTTGAGGMMYYTKVKQLLPIMKEEGYSDYRSYVKIKKDFEPWKCVEFTDNIYLAQKYYDIFPAKIPMQSFCMQIKNISCCFRWSDTPMPDISEEDLEDLEVDDLMDDILAEEIKVISPWIRLYVPKTKDELGKDEEYAKKLSALIGPPSKGGLKTPKREYSSQDEVSRIIVRVNAGIKRTEED